MTDLKQAATLALKALEDERYVSAQIVDAITALKAALEQPKQEPVACRFCHSEKGCWTWQCYHCGEIDDVQKPAQSASQPAQWEHTSASFNAWWGSDVMLSANPFAEGSAAYWAWAGWQAAQRKWQGLTDEELLEACQLAERGNYLVAFQRIQAKLKEKNI
jgi:hypothetical protein